MKLRSESVWNQVADESAERRTTLYLTPRAVWDAQADGPHYQPEAYAADGFIHCTNGEEHLLRVANAFYRGDPRDHVVLVIDLDRVQVDVKYEDADRIFPHIYGPLKRDAVVAELRIERGEDGSYLRIDST